MVKTGFAVNKRKQGETLVCLCVLTVCLQTQLYAEYTNRPVLAGEQRAELMWKLKYGR